MQRGEGLVSILKNSVAPESDQDPMKQRIEAIAAIAKLNDDSPGEPVHSTLRHVVQVLCDEILKSEPLDEYVSLTTANSLAPERVKRTDIQVSLKSSGETVSLGPDGEYKIKPQDIESITLVSKMVEHSPLTEAFHRSRERSIVKPSGHSTACARGSSSGPVRSWRRLLDICKKNESKLKQGGAGSGGQTLVDRITKLREIVRSHPSLFASDVP